MRALGTSLASALLAAWLWSVPQHAHALDVPALSARVNDYASVLPPERAAALEAKLTAYEQRTGHQFALLTVESLKGDAIEPFAIRVAEQWKLGDEKRDDGLLLIVVPSERKLRIEVGYGLEGVVPDAVAARVIRELIAPAFQRGDYAGGIESAFDALMRTASGEAPAPAAAPSTAPERAPRRSPLSMIVLMLFIFSLISMTRRGGRRGGGMWLGPLIGAGMGGFGGGRGGGGGGGGFGGGGGRFGGGGASGGW